MARIETYGLDAAISSNDIILGTDGDNNNATKNFSVQALKDFVINGLSPIDGGTLKITEVIGDIGENTPEGIINSLDPAYIVEPYEIVIVTCDNDTKYLFTKNNDTFGVDETQTVLGDFIKIQNLIDGSETKVTAGTNITVTGLGTVASPYIVNSSASVPNGSETKVNAGTNVTVTGNGTVATPYVVNSTYVNTTYSAGTSMSLVGTTFNNTAPDQVVSLTEGSGIDITGTYPNFTIAVASTDNLQKVITYPTNFTGNNYTLTNADNNYEIIINNGANAVTITVPSGLSSKIGVGFTQKGTGEVSYIASGTTINNPIGLKIKGQYYQTYISQEASTNIFYLGGNTKV